LTQSEEKTNFLQFMVFLFSVNAGFT